jgi:hypothetical protein
LEENIMKVGLISYSQIPRTLGGGIEKDLQELIS